MAQRLVVVANVGGLFFDRLLKPSRAAAGREAVAVFKHVIKTRFAVDENLVRTASQLAVDDGAVDDVESAVLERFDMRVIARSARIIQHHRIVGRTTNRASGLWQKTKLPLPTTGIGDFQMSHGG